MEQQGNERQHVQRIAGQATETLGIWADINARVVNDLFDLSSGALRESVRVLSELQEAGMETWRAGQIAALRWQTSWPQALREPIRWYQQTLETGAESLSRTLELNRRGAEAVARSVDRLQHNTAGAVRGIQDTIRSGASRLHDAGERKAA